MHSRWHARRAKLEIADRQRRSDACHVRVFALRDEPAITIDHHPASIPREAEAGKAHAALRDAIA